MFRPPPSPSPLSCIRLRGSQAQGSGLGPSVLASFPATPWGPLCLEPVPPLGETVCSKSEVEVHPWHIVGAHFWLVPLSRRVPSTSLSQAYSRCHGGEIGLDAAGSVQRARPVSPPPGPAALLAGRGLLAGGSVEGAAGSKLRAGRTRPVLSRPRSLQGRPRAGAGGGPRRKWLTFAARAGNGQAVEEELECPRTAAPSAPPPEI